MTDRAALLIGLTGPIGCGKSTVARWLAADGATLIDGDVIARAVTAPGERGHDAVLEHFGDAYRDAHGNLDRAGLGRHVFADREALVALEAIVHPLVKPRILAAIDDARAAGAPVVVLEAIRLIEGGYAPLCDEVWLITCPPDVQLERLIGRGLAAADARQRAAAQAERIAQWAAAATRVIHTAGSMTEAQARVRSALAAALANQADREEHAASTARQR